MSEVPELEPGPEGGGSETVFSGTLADALARGIVLEPGYYYVIRIQFPDLIWNLQTPLGSGEDLARWLLDQLTPAIRQFFPEEKYLIRIAAQGIEIFIDNVDPIVLNIVLILGAIAAVGIAASMLLFVYRVTLPQQMTYEILTSSWQQLLQSGALQKFFSGVGETAGTVGAWLPLLVVAFLGLAILQSRR